MVDRPQVSAYDGRLPSCYVENKMNALDTPAQLQHILHKSAAIGDRLQGCINSCTLLHPTGMLSGPGSYGNIGRLLKMPLLFAHYMAGYKTSAADSNRSVLTLITILIYYRGFWCSPNQDVQHSDTTMVGNTMGYGQAHSSMNESTKCICHGS
jgi:hypothetical protein